MGVVGVLGAETQTLADEVLTASGTVSISQLWAMSGLSSYRCNPVGTAIGYVRVGNFSADAQSGTPALNPAYSNAWAYVNALPANEEMLVSAMNGVSRKVYATINSAGICKIYTPTSGLVATGTHPVAAGSVHNFGLRGGNGASATFEFYIDGILDASGTASQAANNVTNFAWGKFQDINGGGYDIFFDDAIFDDSKFNHFARLELFLPNGNGSPAGWTSGTGPSDYTQVNEIPKSVVDYLQSPGIATHLLTIPTMASKGLSNSTIVALVANIYTRENVSVTSNTKLRLVSGATTDDTTGFNNTTTVNIMGKVYNVDPNTGAAWTEADVNAIQFGATELNAVAVRMIWAGIYLVHIPATSIPPTRRLLQSLNRAAVR